LSYKQNTLARDKGRIAIVTNRGLGSDGRDGVGASDIAGLGSDGRDGVGASDIAGRDTVSNGLPRTRHGADSVFAWLRGRAHATPRSDMRGRARTEKSCGPDARGSGVKPRGDAAADRHAHRSAARRWGQ